jgi:hypothetical protein
MKPEDDADLISCDHCGERTTYETSVSHIGVRYCAACDAEWRTNFHACAHQWGTMSPHDDYGDLGRYCGRCCAVVTDDSAMRLFPLICDGWAQVPHG